MIARRTLLLAPALLPLAASAARAQPRKVRIGQATPAVSFLPIQAARAMGTFDKDGLGLDWAGIAGDPACLAALDSGDIDAAAVGTETFLNAVARGQPFQMVFSLMSKVTLQLVVGNALLKRTGVTVHDPLPKRLAAMKGAVVGVSAIGGTQDRAARWLAQEGGLDPRTGIQVALAGPPPALQAALGAGRIDAYVLSPPEGLRTEDEGTGAILVRMGDEFPQLSGLPSLVLVVKTPIDTPVDAARAALLRATCHALSDACAQVLADPAAAAKLIQAKLYPKIKPALMAAAIESLKSGIAPHGRFDAGGIEAVLAYAGDTAKGLDSSKPFWTNTYLDPAT